MLRKVSEGKLEGKNVLLVVDYNIQIKNNKPVCAYKIDQTFETIRYILNSACQSLTITTHLGRPKNREECSIKPLHEYLASFYKGIKQVQISELITNNKPTNTKEHTQPEMYFTDNNRYYDDDSLRKFYSLYDMIVNDAFGCAHRPAPFTAYAGFLLEREYEKLKEAQDSDLVIMGGAKVKDKLKILNNFACTIFVGGGIATTIMNSLGFVVGDGSIKEKYDKTLIKERVVFGDAKLSAKLPDIPKNAVILPIDFVVVDKFNNYLTKKYYELEKGDTCIDIGQMSLRILQDLVKKSTSVLWNGPLGKIEDRRATSTYKAVEMLSRSNSKVYIGGGETLSAVIKMDCMESFEHVSTGGGAMLQFLSNGEMPGIKACRSVD